MPVFNVDNAINSSKNPKGISLSSWVGYKSRKECTGVVNRAVPSALGISLSCGSPRYVAQWVYEKGGNKYYTEVNPISLLKAPQFGDIVIYRCPTYGATHTANGPFHKVGDRIGHTIMWLPNPKTGEGSCWVSDYIQDKWYVYGSRDFEFLRAFRLSISYSWKGKEYKTTTLSSISDPGYYGGYKGNPSNISAAKSSTGSGSSQQNNNSNQQKPPDEVNTNNQPKEDPNKNAGLVTENCFKNAYSNILGYETGNTNAKRLKHTRIYALFTSSIVLDEMSLNITSLPDEEIGDIVNNDGSKNNKTTIESKEESLEETDETKETANTDDEFIKQENEIMDLEEKIKNQMGIQ